ncbi:hypothetical protein N9L02_00935 [Gammaproteobacteria bacterium]|nr:hypothetical protein [Gammaproteobacteria bacterium]
MLNLIIEDICEFDKYKKFKKKNENEQYSDFFERSLNYIESNNQGILNKIQENKEQSLAKPLERLPKKTKRNKIQSTKSK